MKRFLIVAASGLFLLVVAASCSGISKKKAARTIQASVDIANEQIAGKRVDAITIVDSVVFNGVDLLYYDTVDERLMSMGTLNDNISVLKSKVMASWTTDESLVVMGSLLKELGGEVVYIYSGSESHEILTFSFVPGE